MGSPQSWTVVVFEATEAERESVQAVPSCWINGDQCAWPPLPGDRINMALRKGQFSTSWPTHKVRILRNSTYADYSVARKKAQKAEMTSDLGTDAEEDLRRKRIRVSRRISSSDSEVNETPKHMRQKLDLPKPPKLMSPRILASGIADEEEFEKFSPPQGSQAFHEVNETACETPLERSYTSKEKTGNKENHPCYCKENKKSLFIIKNLLLELNGKVDKLLTLPAAADREILKEKIDILTKSELTYPIKYMENLIKLNQFLEQEENYRMMVTFLANQGGVNLGEFIRRCLAPLLHDDIALQYSFEGRKQKQPFRSLLICKAVLDATEQSPFNNSKKEAEQAIAAWLKRAQERKRRDELKTPRILQ